MKISEIITDKYKLRIPPTVYYELLADVQEAEEEQEQKTGHWVSKHSTVKGYYWECDSCLYWAKDLYNYCPNCGARMEVEE